MVNLVLSSYIRRSLCDFATLLTRKYGTSNNKLFADTEVREDLPILIHVAQPLTRRSA